MKTSRFRMAAFGLLALASAVALAGFPTLSPDVIAGLGVLGMLGTTDGATILEALNKATADMRGYVDRKIEETRKDGAATPETLAAIEKANADITELRKALDEAVKAAQRPQTGGDDKRSDPEMELRKSAFLKLVRYGAGETGRSMMSADELRALQSSSDAEGGFLVPTDFESGVLMAAYDQAELRPLCNVAPTGRDRVFMPALAKPTVAWGKTGIAVDPQALSAGGESIEIFDLKALVLIHNNTLEDSDADVWAELQMAFSDAVAEAEDDAFAVGVGSGSPQGVLGHSGVLARYKPSGVAGALFDATHNGVDALIAALYSLKKTYRRNATWAFNSATEGLIRTLKDTNGQYLWQPPVQAGAPATLLGRPVANPEGMPDIAAGAFPIAVGDFRKGYRIRDRKGVSVQRLVERYAEYDQTGFIVKKRTGGQCVMPEAFACVKIATS